MYRTRSSTIGAWLATAILLASIVVAIQPGSAWQNRFIAVPVLALLAWRSWRLGVRANARGVSVSSYLFTKRVAWRNIDCFAVRPAGSYPYVGQVIRNDGRPPVLILGISTARGKTERHRFEAQRPVDELNDMLASWRERQQDTQA